MRRAGSELRQHGAAGGDDPAAAARDRVDDEFVLGDRGAVDDRALGADAVRRVFDGCTPPRAICGGAPAATGAAPAVADAEVGVPVAWTWSSTQLSTPWAGR